MTDKENRECTGTFDFCRNCPAHVTCCSRVTHGGEVEPPIIFDHEIEQIAHTTGKSRELFSEPCSGSNSMHWMLGGQHGCYFYRDGKCSIYSVRPIDCKLFPFDVLENKEGKHILIAYTSLCPDRFDPRRYIEHARKLLAKFGSHIQEYVHAPTPRMDNQPYVVLGTIDEILGQSG